MHAYINLKNMIFCVDTEIPHNDFTRAYHSAIQRAR